MCGIAGFSGRTEDQYGHLSPMLGEIIHRGPDSEGTYMTNDVSMGMRRLSINDLHTGDQPLFNEDKSIVLLYNGEIYNSPRLKEQLQSKGHSFYTGSDGEVIVHLYEEYGEKAFEQLDGMFAVSLWDSKNKRLLLARDFAGEKPLYYSFCDNNRLVYASEIKAIAKFPFLNKDLDYKSVWDFPSFLWIPEPNTIYKNVKALQKGHYMVYENNKARIEPIKNIFTVDAPTSTEEYIQLTRDVVEGAIKDRLLSDVRIGGFLSSGLDSSIICSVSSKEVKDFSTFTIGFENVDDPYHGKADESVLATEFAKILGTNHSVIRVKGQDFYDELDTFCKHGDQPFAVSSGLGILFVSKAAQEQGVRVLLSGDGADECFGGYSWYEHLGNNVAPLQGDPGDLSFQNFGTDLESRLGYLNAMSPQQRAWAWHYYASEQEKQRLFTPDVYKESESSYRWFKDYKSDSNWQPSDFIDQDRDFYFPNEMLKKVDRMTMAYSIEGRAPFASAKVLDLASKIPFDLKVKGKTLKWVLRQAFSDVLPQHVIDVPKHGFNVPIDHWLKKEWAFLMEETFSKSSELYKMGFIHDKSYEEAQMMLNDKNRLNGHSLLCYIMLNKWLENK